MKKRIGVLAIGSGLLISIAACSSAESGDAKSSGDSDSVTVAEPIAVSAAPESESEIGVVAWGVATDGPNLIARGYDRKGKVVATIEHHLETLGKNRVKVEDSVATSDGKTEGKVDVEVEGDLAAAQAATDEADAVEISFKQVGENTFNDNPKAQAIAERFSKDTETEAAPKQTSLTGGKSLHPQMGRGPGNGQTALRDGAKSGSKTCLNLGSDCAVRVGETAAGLYFTAKSCTIAAKNIALVARCIGGGALVGGPIGAIGAGLICGTVAIAKGTISEIGQCGLGVKGAIDGASNVKQACTKECKSEGAASSSTSSGSTTPAPSTPPAPAGPPTS
jgi:hypothetical protein